MNFPSLLNEASFPIHQTREPIVYDNNSSSSPAYASVQAILQNGNSSSNHLAQKDISTLQAKNEQSEIFITTCPVEILFHIFSFINDPLLTKQVCKNWQEISHQILLDEQKIRLTNLIGDDLAELFLTTQPASGFARFKEIEQFMRDYNLMLLCKELYFYQSIQKEAIQTIDQVKKGQFCITEAAQKLRATLQDQDLSQITNLHLESIGLTFLPLEISLFTNLKTLYLQKNKLQNIKNQLSKLTKLTFLNLSDNQLQSVPEQIDQLASLRDLDLANNRLKSLPSAMGNLKLTRLSLSHNQLREPSPVIWQLTTLQRLTLSGNNIESIPSEIGQLTHLSALYLGKNRLTEIPKELGSLTNLTMLCLDDNSLTHLIDDIQQLENLIFLDLHNNQLKEYPTVIDTLKSKQLQRCNLTNNPF